MELLVELASESRSAFTRHSRGEGEGRGGTGGLIWKMSVGSFSDSDTPPHPGYLGPTEGCVQDISCSLKYYAYFFYSHED